MNKRQPSVGTAAIVIRDGRVLMGKRLVEHGMDTWAFPGGKVEMWEEPADAVVRELLEEAGLRAATCDFVTLTNDMFVEHDLHYVTLFYTIQAYGNPVAMEPDKCAEWLWFNFAELPSPLFPTVNRLLAQGWCL